MVGCMNIRPIYDRILVQRAKAEDMSRGGIIIPDKAKEKPFEAVVISVGNGKRDESGTLHPLSVQAGDRVLFSKYSGTEVDIDGVSHMIMREEDVLAVIDRESDAT
jgi:chaperonin GroES